MYTHDTSIWRLTIMNTVFNDRRRKSTLGTESAEQTIGWPLLVHYGNVKSEALLMDSSDQTKGQSEPGTTYLVAICAQKATDATRRFHIVVRLSYNVHIRVHPRLVPLLLVPITAKWKYICPQTNRALRTPNREKSLPRKVPGKSLIEK